MNYTIMPDNQGIAPQWYRDAWSGDPDCMERGTSSTGDVEIKVVAPEGWRVIESN